MCIACSTTNIASLSTHDHGAINNHTHTHNHNRTTHTIDTLTSHTANALYINCIIGLATNTYDDRNNTTIANTT